MFGSRKILEFIQFTPLLIPLQVYEVLDTYLWLSLRFPDMLPDELAVRDACRQLDTMLQVSVENILEILENSAMGDARKVN